MVAQSVEHQTCDQETDGVNPGCVMLPEYLGQVIHTYVHLSPSSTVWYWSKQGC